MRFGFVYDPLTIRFKAWAMVKRRVYRRKPRRRPRKRPHGRARAGVYARLIGDIGVFCMMTLIGLAALFAYFARDLPDPASLWSRSGAPKVTLLAADGSPIPIHGAVAGAPVRLADLPSHVPGAILAVEDRNFYHHAGVNPVSIVRALIVNLREGGVRQGGSTITQQLAKNVFLSPDQTMRRKVQEALLAFWLEWKFTKDEILTLYLNRVYFGAGAYGVDAASYRYFAKPARRLSVGEAAVLAGLLKAPSRYAPTANPDHAGRRGRLVIDQMRAGGFLTPDEAAAAIAAPITLAASRFSTAPYFVDYALAEARALSGALDADLIVRTTFDPRLQRAAERGLAAGLAGEAGAPDAAEAAVVIMDGEGSVRALIGGRDYRKSQFNRAVQARRQPGSAFKPVVYLAALEAGASPETVVEDAPVTIGTWSPGNYKGKYYGAVTLREAMARSLNSAAVRTQEYAGRARVRRMAKDLGWPGRLTHGPSLALGVDAVSPLQLAGVYAPFANGGLRIEPHVITRIETSDGDLVYRRPGSVLGQAASTQTIAALNDMLRAVVVWGSGRAAATPGYAAAGKTGTTQNSRDAWFAGHAAGLVGVVWIGRDDNAPMPGVTGGRAPARVWSEMMRRALPLHAPPPEDGAADPIAAILKTSG